MPFLRLGSVGFVALGGLPPSPASALGFFFGVLSGLALLFLVPLLACCCCPSLGSCYGQWSCLVASSCPCWGFAPSLRRSSVRRFPSPAPHYPGLFLFCGGSAPLQYALRLDVCPPPFPSWPALELLFGIVCSLWLEYIISKW